MVLSHHFLKTAKLQKFERKNSKIDDFHLLL
jgi:hypothetical protein